MTSVTLKLLAVNVRFGKNKMTLKLFMMSLMHFYEFVTITTKETKFMKSKKPILLLLCISISFIFFTGSALALTQEFGSQTFNLTFNNPGARAMGMGGAFIGVADDATAAYTNPAGLTILTRPELAAEYKYTQYKTTVNNVTLFGSPVNAYDVSSINKVNGISFLSFAYPTEKVTFTVFRHELVNLDTDVPVSGISSTSYNKVRFNVDTLGVAAGVKLAKSFSMGINISFSDLDWHNYSSPDVLYPYTYQYTDSKTHGSIGLFWNPFGDFNIGAVYRYGPEFSYYYNNSSTGDKHQDSIKIPDSYGLGLSYRFFNALTVAADVNYVQYSQIMKDLKVSSVSFFPASDYKCDDSLDVSAGLEYSFSLASVFWAVRGGYHYVPGHTSYYNGPNDVARTAMPKAKDEHIGSAGIGVVLGKNFQIDCAGSWSDIRNEYIGSLVYRF